MDFETRWVPNPIMSNRYEFRIAQYCLSLGRLLSVGCATAFLFGCAHSKCPLPVQHEVLIPKPFDVVWPAVIQEAAAAGTNNADRTTGSIHVEEVRLDDNSLPIEQYACSPGGTFAHWTSSRVMLHFDVVPVSPTETRVNVVCRFYRFSSKRDDAWRMWPSTGRLEQQLLANISARAAQ